MARRLTTAGTEFQVNLSFQANSQITPDIATMTDGTFVTVFQDSAILTPDTSAHRFTATGVPVLAADTAVTDETGDQNDPAIASRLGGGYVSVYEDDDHSATDPDIYLTVVSNADVVGAHIEVAGNTVDAGDPLRNPDVAMLSDGRNVVVYQRDGATSDVHLRIASAAAVPVFAAGFIDVASGAGNQRDAAVAAAGLNALVAYEDTALGGSVDITARLFNGTTDSFGTAFTVANTAADNFNDVDVARLGGDRFVITYNNGNDVFGKIYDPTTPDGAFLSAQFRVDSTTGGTSEDAHVTGTIDGGFIVVWDETIAGSIEVRARRFDARGLAYGDEFTVNTFTNGNQDDAVIAVSGVNVMVSWEDGAARVGGDTDPDGIRAQMFTTTAFDFDSARFGDFDNNGRDDILYQNDTGRLAIWATNSSGAVNTIVDIGLLPTGFRVDGTGQFNSTAGDDILLRSPNQVAVLPMNGFVPQPHVVLGGTTPEFLNSGNGDFTGDSQSDLLFRHVNDGRIVTWGVANNALTVAPTVLGSTAATFRIVAVDDFTGDQQSDILFRDETNGDIAVWRVANNGLAGVPAVVGSTAQAFHVVGTGDFDGNNSFDILFRHDNGDVVVWLLNSQGQLLTAPQLVGNQTLDFHVEGTGDLNGDNRSDIVFRSGEGQLVSWLMNGATLLQPPAVLGPSIAVDFAVAAHHFDIV